MSIFLSMFNRRDTFILEVYSCIIQEDNALNCRLCRWVHPNMGETCSMDEVTSHRVFENIFHQLKCEGTLVSLRRKSFRILFPIKIRGSYEFLNLWILWDEGTLVLNFWGRNLMFLTFSSYELRGSVKWLIHNCLVTKLVRFCFKVC